MKNKPLTLVLKPKQIDDIIGQTHLLGENSLIVKMIQKNICYSSIFYGPPGIGKSSLASCLANELKIPYQTFNASIDKKEDLIKIIELAKLSKNYLLIIEEVHRMNKDKQDILLSVLEKDVLRVFLTTTENPFFSIIPAIRSRCQIIELKPINNLEMISGMNHFIEKYDLNLKLNLEQQKRIANHANGDLRILVNVLDILINLYTEVNKKTINDKELDNVLLQSNILGYVDGDEIHDLKSALQKSIRGSDENASLYYLGRLINIGDYEIIFRRLAVVLYEDIGLANPNLCLRGSVAIETARKVGFPEARYILAELVTEMALSEKTNSTSVAIDEVLKDLANGLTYGVPNHIRDNNYKSAVKLGVKGYLYPHDFAYHYIKQSYLPTQIKHKKYYKVNDYNQIEKKIKKVHEEFVNKANEANKRM